MRTLFIHPTDPSTAFCSVIYQDYLQWDNVTLITGNHISRNVLTDALRTHDRIVFLGHGTELGLLDMRYDWRYLVTSRDLQFFRDKECICFWCNANIFAEKYDLNAFATGMFVSELSEARRYNLPEDQNLIDSSNILMCNILSRCIFDPIEQIRDTIYRGYVSTNNPIIQFNRECMGFNDI
jgi:hypothetical protein